MAKRKVAEEKSASPMTTTAKGRVIHNTAAAARPKRGNDPSQNSKAEPTHVERVTKRRKVTLEPATAARKPVGRPKSKSKRDTEATVSLPSHARKSKDDDGLDGDDDDDDNDDDNDSHGYWLMKAEPESRLEKTASGIEVDVRFSIDDLEAKSEPEPWEGIRNPSAQKNLKAMKVGDLALFYESNVKRPGIVGLMEIVREASADHSQFDDKSPYYDAKSTLEDPRWQLVHVAFRRKFGDKITLKELQSFGKEGGILRDMQLLKQSRLSVSKVTRREWDFIKSLVGEDEFDVDQVDQDNENMNNDTASEVKNTSELEQDSMIVDEPGQDMAKDSDKTQDNDQRIEITPSFEEPTGVAAVSAVVEGLEFDGLLGFLDVTNQSVASVDMLAAEAEVTSPTMGVMSPVQVIEIAKTSVLFQLTPD